MKSTTVSNALSDARELVDVMGGPRPEAAEDEQFAVKIPLPPDAADAVIRRLAAFADAIAEATNVRLVGMVFDVTRVGRRDGLIALPGPRGAVDLVRPPYVAQLIDVGRLAIANAQTIGDIHRAKFTLDQGVADVSGTARVGLRRRWLHAGQLGSLALVFNLAVACFVAIGSRVSAWSGAEPTSPGWVPDGWAFLATVLIVVLGIMSGFYRATRERTLMKLRSAASSDADPPPEVHVTHLADRDPLVQRAWFVGLGLSATTAGLVGLADVLEQANVPIGRSLLAMAVWVVWGSLTFVGAALLSQLSQHWLNVLPLEIDLEDADGLQAQANRRSSDVGDRYVATVLVDQHTYVVAAVVALIDRYYEANLSSRRSSATEALDRFVLEDLEAARTELQALAPPHP